MFQSLLTFIKKYSYMPADRALINLYLFCNSLTFSYKLICWVSVYIYLTDTLRSVTIRVYNLNWNSIFLTVFFSYSLVIVIFTMA